MIKSKQIFAELAVTGDYLGGKNVGVIGETQPNGLVRYFHNMALGTEPSCASQVRGLANICVHR